MQNIVAQCIAVAPRVASGQLRVLKTAQSQVFATRGGFTGLFAAAGLQSLAEVVPLFIRQLIVFHRSLRRSNRRLCVTSGICRDRTSHQWFDSCARFCELYDQAAFDPAYPTKPLSYFAPMLREVFGRKAFDAGVL